LGFCARLTRKSQKKKLISFCDIFHIDSFSCSNMARDALHDAQRGEQRGEQRGAQRGAAQRDAA